MLKPALLFQNHMVLQRDKAVHIWGLADPGALVAVSIQGKIYNATVERTGGWIVTCDPLETSFSEELTIACGSEMLRFQDVQIGEVWLAGGQSNMEFHMRYDADMEAERDVCQNDNIRFFDYPEVSYVGQIDEADYGKSYGFWRKAAREQLDRFSAIGYYFAKDLQAKYNVPIGIIGCNWGGTPACAWMSKEAIEAGGGQIYLDEYADAIKRLDFEAYDKKFQESSMSWRVDILADPISDITMMTGTMPMEEIMAKLLEAGIDLTTMDLSEMIPAMGPKHEGRPSGLYESMLMPIASYSIRGVIWYQGETDGDRHPEVYRTLFPALIQDWRKLWGEELTFLFVQIAPLESWSASVGERYIEIRDAQQFAADTVPQTGMAVITDIGMQFDIHPKKKKPVGHRLALLAENKAYGDNVLCEAPTLLSASLGDGKLTLVFDNAGDGLYLSEQVPFGQTVGKNVMGGLQVFQDGEELNLQPLNVRADGNTVVISGEEIEAGLPTQVKLAKTGWYLVNLYNSAGIPARPAEVYAVAE